LGSFTIPMGASERRRGVKMSSDKKKGLVSLIGGRDFDTPLDRILKRPLRLFICLAAHKEISDPKQRSVPVEETLEFIAQNFEIGEA